eukprot:6583274-Prymnesium_polylepis.1
MRVKSPCSGPRWPRACTWCPGLRLWLGAPCVHVVPWASAVARGAVRTPGARSVGRGSHPEPMRNVQKKDPAKAADEVKTWSCSR